MRNHSLLFRWGSSPPFASSTRLREAAGSLVAAHPLSLVQQSLRGSRIFSIDSYQAFASRVATDIAAGTRRVGGGLRAEEVIVSRRWRSR